MLEPGSMSEYDAKQVLADAGIATVAEQRVDSAEDAVAAAEELGFPVILKVDSRDVQHKTDIGAVATAHDPEEVEKGYDRITAAVEDHAPDAAIEGVLVEEQLDGHETIIGVSVDPDFGHVIMFGLGGIFVEVLEDVHFRALPIDEWDAEQLIDEMQSRPLLEGVRGEDPVDTDAIVDTMLKVSDLVETHPEIAELDINPLFVSSDGAVAADALIRVEDR